MVPLVPMGPTPMNTQNITQHMHVCIYTYVIASRSFGIEGAQTT